MNAVRTEGRCITNVGTQFIVSEKMAGRECPPLFHFNLYRNE